MRIKSSGSFFLLFLAARLNIPAAALGLKKYRRRWSPVVSKISDNEDSVPSLGDSEKLRVQDSPAATIPALAKRCEQGRKI